MSRTYIYLNNRLLIGHGIANSTESSPLECARLCLHQAACKSFNYFERNHDNCQLNDTDNIESPEDMENSDGASYGTYYADMLEG